MKNSNFEVFFNEVPGGLGLIVMHSFNTGTMKAGVYARLTAEGRNEGQYLSFEAENTPENREILYNAARSWVNEFLYKNIFEGKGIVLEMAAFPKGYQESEEFKIVNSHKILHLCLYHPDFVSLIMSTVKSTRFRDHLQNLDDFSKRIKVESLA